MAVYDDIDFDFSWNGDYLLGNDGDLSDTSDDTLRSLIQDIHSICASAFNDWEFSPRRAAELDDFIGEPNIITTGDRIHDRVRLALTSNGVVLEDDLDIRVIPVHIHKVLIIIKINATATPLNKITRGQVLIVQLVFDFFEQGIFFLSKVPTLTANG